MARSLRGLLVFVWALPAVAQVEVYEAAPNMKLFDTDCAKTQFETSCKGSVATEFHARDCNAPAGRVAMLSLGREPAIPAFNGPARKAAAEAAISSCSSSDLALTFANKSAFDTVAATVKAQTVELDRQAQEIMALSTALICTLAYVGQEKEAVTRNAAALQKCLK